MVVTTYFDWFCLELSKLTGLPPEDEIVRYVANIHEQPELREYLSDLLNTSNPEHSAFIKMALLRNQDRNLKTVDMGGPEMTLYKKPHIAENYVDTRKEQTKKKKGNQRKNTASQLAPPTGLQSVDERDSGTFPGHTSSRKTKYVPLFSQEGKSKDVIHLPGRHPCECQASKHTLIANCLHCGRIVCSQEGSGPCFTCKNLVCSREEREYIAKGSKKSIKLYEKLMSEPTTFPDGDEADGFVASQLEKAVEHKNKLLEFDKTSAKRTQVIDDDSDYFKADQWMSPEMRKKLQAKEEELHARRHASRRDRKITLDFAGRAIMEESDTIDYQAEVDQILSAESDYKSSEKDVNFLTEDFPNIDPGVGIRPEYVGDKRERRRDHDSETKDSSNMDWSRALKIQDRGLQEMSDQGMCLSLHQPWASLLIAGIKKHEGRVWYTAHRGCLWIQAGSKVPLKQDIADVERFYEARSRDRDLQFPSHYPTGCLLGCVNLVDCLPQEEYREQFPDGESESPYVFICEEPQELAIKFPIKGQHKIFKLEPKIHQAAVKILRK